MLIFLSKMNSSNERRVGNAYDGRASGRFAKAPTWACRSVGRSLPWHGRGPEFKSRHVHSFSLFEIDGVDRAAKPVQLQNTSIFGTARPPVPHSSVLSSMISMLFEGNNLFIH